MTRLSRRTLGKLTLGAAATAATAGLAGCSSGGAETITFYLTKREAIPYYADLVKKFNSSQNDVTVVMDNASNLQAGFLRGNPPDVGLSNYNMEIARFVARGVFSDVSDMPEAKQVKPEVQKLVSQYAVYPGRTSVLPYSVMAASVIYNKDLFAKHGQKVPTTWTELIAVCEAFKKAGVRPFTATFKDPWTIAQGWWDYTTGGAVDMADFFKKLGDEGKDVGPDSAVSFQKTLLEPTQKMVELSSKYTEPNAAGMGYGDGNLAFAQGKGAMYLQGPWALSEVAKTAKVNSGHFPLPMTEDAADLKVRVNLDLAAWIPEATKNKEAARKFLSFLFDKEVQDAYNASQLGYGTMTNSASPTDPRITEMTPFYEKAAFYQGASVTIPQTIPTANYLQAMILGSDPKSTLATLDADWARLAMRQ